MLFRSGLDEETELCFIDGDKTFDVKLPCEFAAAFAVIVVGVVVPSAAVMEQGEQTGDGRIATFRPGQSQGIVLDPQPMRQSMDSMKSPRSAIDHAGHEAFGDDRMLEGHFAGVPS